VFDDAGIEERFLDCASRLLRRSEAEMQMRRLAPLGMTGFWLLAYVFVRLKKSLGDFTGIPSGAAGYSDDRLLGTIFWIEAVGHLVDGAAEDGGDLGYFADELG
jgi:hypothetical protein